MSPPVPAVMPAGARAMPLATWQAESLGERLAALHVQVAGTVPAVHRMALALYDPLMDTLHTFAASGEVGEPLAAYQCRMADAPGLQSLAWRRQVRVIDDLAAALEAGDADRLADHSRWLLAQGFRSSYTVPLFDDAVFVGFLFFDSCERAAFTSPVTEALEVHGRLVSLMVGHELSAIRALVGSLRMARDFAHLRDVETGAHLDRVARCARLIARVLAPTHRFSDEFVQQVFLFAPLHDIGKLGVPDALLLKAGRFDADERRQMQRHVELGVGIVERLIDDIQLGALPGVGVLRHLVGCHHEFLDGSGYPHGLHGDEVPMEARIVTVADIYDALTHRRPYKPAWTVEASLAQLDGMVAAGQLDGDCVNALRAHPDEIAGIERRFPD